MFTGNIQQIFLSQLMLCLFVFSICLAIALFWRFIWPKKRIVIWFIVWPLLFFYPFGFVGILLASLLAFAIVLALKDSRFANPPKEPSKDVTAKSKTSISAQEKEEGFPAQRPKLILSTNQWANRFDDPFLAAPENPIETQKLKVCLQPRLESGVKAALPVQFEERKTSPLFIGGVCIFAGIVIGIALNNVSIHRTAPRQHPSPTSTPAQPNTQLPSPSVATTPQVAPSMSAPPPQPLKDIETKIPELKGHSFSTAGIMEIQRHLQRLGYYSGRLDGSYGPLMVGAIKAFQRDAGLVPDGNLTETLVTALQKISEVR